MTKDSTFKVIIAGGGVAGLTLANALDKAGIDFVVLEKRDIAPDIGSALSILCSTAKVFDQLGIWGTVSQATLPLLYHRHYDETGRLFDDEKAFQVITREAGAPPTFLARHTYLETLYSNLADKSKVRTHTGLRSFQQDGRGVVVKTDSGDVVKGSILIGADGVHSRVRGLVAEACSSATGNLNTPTAIDQAFVTRYRALFGTSTNHFKEQPTRTFQPDAMACHIYYRNVSVVCISSMGGRLVWFLYIKEAAPIQTPDRPRYTEADIEATVEKYGHLSAGQNFTFQDIWAARIQGGMVPMEEGVVEAPWSTGRVLLMADAVHKPTINLGFGANTAIEGVCHFVNELVPLLRETQDPDLDQIGSMFGRWEAKQRPRAKLSVTMSSYMTRYEAMDTWWLRVIRRASPWFPDYLKAQIFLRFIAPAPMLDFLPKSGIQGVADKLKESG